MQDKAYMVERCVVQNRKNVAESLSAVSVLSLVNKLGQERES